MAKVFITGIAGFIGSALAHSLVKDGHEVRGVDSFNEYYDVNLKRARERNLERAGVRVDETNVVHGIWAHIDNRNPVDLGTLGTSSYPRKLFQPDVVVHLAAYAGVRHSMANEDLYVTNNITGTKKVIECCERLHVPRVVYASTSCVQAGQELPWKESDRVVGQTNPYGWTKYVNEQQFNNSRLPQAIGLRFFTVYGPWGRPDMALFEFVDKIYKGEPLHLFNYGQMKRDFTYVDDIVAGVKIAMFEESIGPREIFNIGRGEQVDLFKFVHAIENATGKFAKIELEPKHPADTVETWSDTTKLQALGYKPKVSIGEGVDRFVEWYRNYYRID